MHRTPHRKHRAPLFAVAIFSLVGASCASDVDSPPFSMPTPFYLRILVRDGTGTPIPGLRISAWSELRGLTGHGPPSPAPLQKPTAASTIGFFLPVSASVALDVLELDNSIVSTIIAGTILEPGHHQAALVIQRTAGTRVFKCRLTARGLSPDSLLHADSIFAVLHQPEAFQSVLGWTSAAGTLETADSLAFPGILALPILPHTTPLSPTPVDTFTISAIVTFVLADTATGRSQTVRHLLSRGRNDLVFGWSPGPGSGPAAAAGRGTGIGPRQSPARGEGWVLEQNYPNPFN